MTVSLILDGLIVVLLALTIAYAVALNRKLKRLRDGEGDLRAMIDTFNKSAATAEANLARIRGIAEGTGTLRSLDAGNRPRDGEINSASAALAPLVEEARKLAVDLDLLISRGEVIANGSAPSPKVRAGRPGSVDAANRDRSDPVKGMDPALLDALRSVR